MLKGVCICQCLVKALATMGLSLCEAHRGEEAMHIASRLSSGVHPSLASWTSCLQHVKDKHNRVEGGKDTARIFFPRHNVLQELATSSKEPA